MGLLVTIDSLFLKSLEFLFDDSYYEIDEAQFSPLKKFLIPFLGVD